MSPVDFDPDLIDNDKERELADKAALHDLVAAGVQLAALRAYVANHVKTLQYQYYKLSADGTFNDSARAAAKLKYGAYLAWQEFLSDIDALRIGHTEGT